MTKKITLAISLSSLLASYAFAGNAEEYAKINTSAPGKYLISYTVKDSLGQETTLTRTVIVKENGLPSITLYGDPSVRIKNGQAFTDPGATASDPEDGDLTQNITTSGSVNTSADGDYTLTYSVTDSFNQTVTKTRTITVYSTDDIDKTVVEEGTKTSIDLWDYLVAKSNNSILLQKYLNGYKDESEIISRSLNGSTLTKSFDYTERKVSYIQGDSEITINFTKEGNTEDSVLIKRVVSLNEDITKDGAADTQNQCRIKAQYNKIKLGGTEYNDVIEMDCGNDTEAYFAKDSGLILQNKKDNSVSEEKISAESKNGTLDADEVYPGSLFKALNLSSAKKIDVEKLWTEYNLHGAGIKVGVVDVGSVRESHIEFGGRIVSLSSSDYSEHSTHVAGTVGASGVRDDAHGIADESTIYSTTFNDSGAFVAAAKTLLDNEEIYITNHSYGFTSNVRVGEYDDYAQNADKVISENPDIIMVKSSGNDRGKSDYDDYKIIKSVGNAKSVFTIGAIEEDDSVAYFSSTGPAPLGRVKPDFVTKGYGILSTTSTGDEDYVLMSGTSMAAPAFAGLMTLISEHYTNVTGNHIKVDEAKSILANTAKDLGRVGPDYEFGFGLPDGYEAAKVIDTIGTENTLVQDRTILKGFNHTYTFTINEETDFSATISWVDPETDNDGYDLVTDLDISLKNKETGEIFYPFSLNGSDGHLEDPATASGPNHVDVVEQIRKTLPAGSYELLVSPFKISAQGAQNYALTTNIHLENYQEHDVYAPIDEIETRIKATLQ